MCNIKGHHEALGNSSNDSFLISTMVNIFNELSKQCGYYFQEDTEMPIHLHLLLESINATRDYEETNK